MALLITDFTYNSKLKKNLYNVKLIDFISKVIKSLYNYCPGVLSREAYSSLPFSLSISFPLFLLSQILDLAVSTCQGKTL